jgi:hypothetical protein
VTPRGSTTPVSFIRRAVRLVLRAGTSLRAVPRVLLEFAAWGRDSGCTVAGIVRDWTTCRWWFLRLGLAVLREAPARGTDWVFVVDHTVQIGPQKCFLVLGVRLSAIVWDGAGLRHTDMQTLALVPMVHSDRRQVRAVLEDVSRRTGQPRAIVSDHGSDVKGGVGDYCLEHSGTAAIYDIAHRGACLLKRCLERDERWAAFQKQAGQTRQRTQQTEFAALRGPSLRNKARYMNLGPVLRWGRMVLGVLDRVPAEYATSARLEAKFGWLRAYRGALQEWWALYETVRTTARFVRRQGLYAGAERELAVLLADRLLAPATKGAAEELVAFVAEQSAAARPGERLPGSSEVLESILGAWKNFERQHAAEGFTGSVLALPAMLRDWTEPEILAALGATPTRLVREWVTTHLGPSVTAQRRAAYAAG